MFGPELTERTPYTSQDDGYAEGVIINIHSGLLTSNGLAGGIIKVLAQDSVEEVGTERLRRAWVVVEQGPCSREGKLNVLSERCGLDALHLSDTSPRDRPPPSTKDASALLG